MNHRDTEDTEKTNPKSENKEKTARSDFSSSFSVFGSGFLI